MVPTIQPAWLKAALSGAFLALILSGCGGGGGGGATEEPTQVITIEEESAETGALAEESNVSTVSTTDADNQNLSPGTQVTLSSLVGTASTQNASKALTEIVLTVDVNGNINLAGLPEGGLVPGDYVLTYNTGSGTITIAFTIGEMNYSNTALIAFPLSKSGDTYTEVYGIIASVSGVITNSDGNVIKGAQVGLSGGAATGGVFVSSITDENGRYQLLVNANSSLADALAEAKLFVSAAGYETKTIFVAVEANTAKTGINASLTTATSTALFRETFDNSSTTAGQWTVQSCMDETYGDWTEEEYYAELPDGWETWTDAEWEAYYDSLYADFDYEYVYDKTCLLTTASAQPYWQFRDDISTISNRAFTELPLVQLAPNDSSNGAVPPPIQGDRAYWYGDNIKGNFLGDSTDTYPDSGGTSNSPNGGVLTSPAIIIPASATVASLTFQNWWEIESVNPNASGFDLMTIQLSTDNGQTWKSIARLNPLSDPATSLNKSPLPFSNTGFNSAPEWRWQEPIALDGIAGKTIRIRFYFDTNDELYNGFRGWLIDDVRIIPQAGTAPLLDSSSVWNVEAAKASRSR